MTQQVTYFRVIRRLRVPGLRSDLGLGVDMIELAEHGSSIPGPSPERKA